MERERAHSLTKEQEEILRQLEGDLKAYLETEVGGSRTDDASFIKKHMESFLHAHFPTAEVDVEVTPNYEKEGVYNVELHVPQWLADLMNGENDNDKEEKPE